MEGHDTFSTEQKGEDLKTYINANLFLVEY